MSLVAFWMFIAGAFSRSSRRSFAAMFEWHSLRPTADKPGPSSHFRTVPASSASSEPCLLLKEFSNGMPTFKAVTMSVPSVEASAGVEAPGKDIEGTRWRIRGEGGTFLHDLRAHFNQNAARMLLLLLGVEAPTRQLP